MKTLLLAVVVGTSLAGLGQAPVALAARPVAPATSKYYVKVYKVVIRGGRKSVTYYKTTGPFFNRATAVGERDFWTAVAADYGNGYRYYYMAEIK